MFSKILEKLKPKVSKPKTDGIDVGAGYDTIKLVVLFGSGPGKTALTVRFVEDKFPEEYDPTIEDVYVKDIKIDGKDVVFEITDTAG